MEVDIWVKPVDGSGSFRAGNSLFGFEVEANSYNQAIEEVRQLISAELDDGTKIVRVNVSSKNSRVEDTNEVLFLIPNLSRSYFSNLITECEKVIATDFGENLRVIVRYEYSKDKSEDGIVEAYARELRQSSKIKFLLVLPNRKNNLGREISRITNNLNRNILVISLSLPFRNNKLRSFPIRPPYIACRSDAGTMQLARDAIRRMHHRGKESANVVLIAGARNRIDSRYRIRGFISGLQQKPQITDFDSTLEAKFESMQKQEASLAENSIDTKQRTQSKHDRPFSFNLLNLNENGIENQLYGNWSRELSAVRFAKLVDHCREDIDIVFAANDDMAMGVYDSIQDFKRNNVSAYRKTADCIIYGFDNIPDAEKLIKSGDHHFKGSVEQPAREMAERLSKIIREGMKPGFNPASMYDPTKKTWFETVSPKVKLGPMPAESPDVPPVYEANETFLRVDNVFSGKKLQKISLKPFFPTKDTMKKYEQDALNNKLKTNKQDQYGIYGHRGKGKRKRRYRIIDGKVYWWVSDPNRRT